MATCKTCGTKYHACSSCGIDDWEWDYCSVECRFNSPVLVNPKLIKIFRFYTKDQLVQALEFLHGFGWSEDCSEVSKFINGIGDDSALQHELDSGNFELHELKAYVELQLR